MVEKAIIRVLEGPNAGDIKVMFNPTEYSDKKEVKATIKNSRIHFDVVNMSEFPVTLIFDTYEAKTDVRELTENIASLLLPTVEGKNTKRPPECLFVWGSFSYKGIITKIDRKFTMFLDNGTPVRCTLNVTFNSVIIQQEEEKLNKIKHSRKFWTVKSGDRLDLIANSTLKDPAQWRRIADANKINNPLRFPSNDDIGRILVIPE